MFPWRLWHLRYVCKRLRLLCIGVQHKLALVLSQGNLLQGGLVVRAADVAMGVFIPLHSHVALNSVMTDYVPKSALGQSLLIDNVLPGQF